MIREWADKDQLERIDDLLIPPADWRDPFTGNPAGWEDETVDDAEAQFWAEWERSRVKS